MNDLIKDFQAWADSVRPYIETTNSVVKKVAKISREVLDIYSAIKERDYVSLVLGGASAFGVLAENLINIDSDYDNILVGFGVHQICPSVDSFVHNVLKQSNTPMKKVWGDKGKEDTNNGHIEEYDLGGSKAYFIVTERSNFISGVYVKDENKFYEDMSKLIEEKIGRFLIIENVTDFKSWGKKMEISSIPVSNDVYVSCNAFDECEIVDSVRKFFARGLNRSMLFFGPPGTGKSTLAVRITNILGGRILILDGDSISSRSSSTLFQIISIVDPTVILFDDLDRFDGIANLLGDIERMNRMKSGRSKLIIATVNNIGNVPPAMRRPGRFDQSVEFLPPNEGARLKVLLAYANQFKTVLDEEQLKPLAEITDGMTQAYLREVILRAEVLGTDRIVEHIEQMKRVALFKCNEENENCDNENENYDNEKNNNCFYDIPCAEV